MDASMKETILRLWNQGSNTWVIAQRSGATENDVIDVVEEEQKRLAEFLDGKQKQGVTKMKMECEAGHKIDTEHTCYFCGEPPGPNARCRNKPVDTTRQELKEAHALICTLQNELRQYREREKTMGWAD